MYSKMLLTGEVKMPTEDNLKKDQADSSESSRFLKVEPVKYLQGYSGK